MQTATCDVIYRETQIHMRQTEYREREPEKMLDLL